MCLSDAYKKRDETDELLCKNVAKALAENGGVRLVDLLGRERWVPGEIESIDLVENRIILRDPA